MDECVGVLAFFASAVGNFMKKMKNHAVVDNFGCFDKEIDKAGTVGLWGSMASMDIPVPL